MATYFVNTNKGLHQAMWHTYFQGTDMHIDPVSTDAFNALFRGHKWWVYLPSDIYEFEEELTCDETCSDLDKHSFVSNPIVKKSVTESQKNALWFSHILPQIR